MVEPRDIKNEFVEIAKLLLEAYQVLDILNIGAPKKQPTFTNMKSMGSITAAN